MLESSMYKGALFASVTSLPCSHHDFCLGATDSESKVTGHLHIAIYQLWLWWWPGGQNHQQTVFVSLTGLPFKQLPIIFNLCLR